MILGAPIGRCANKNADSPREVDYEIPYWLERERNIHYKGMKNERERNIHYKGMKNERERNIHYKGMKNEREWNIVYKGMKNERERIILYVYEKLWRVLKFWGEAHRESPKTQYPLAVGLGYYT